MTRLVIVTGAAGAIGMAICTAFAEAGHQIVAIDLCRPDSLCEDAIFVEIDLSCYSSDPNYRGSSNVRLRDAVKGMSLVALINNAAIQIIKPAGELTADDWHRTLNVNLLAPFLLTQALLDELTAARGAVVNISSIHAQLTKPEFVAYATSKAALSGLTRSLAVDLGGRVRVNSICPAAIDTPMLREGFAGQEELLGQLGQMHPAGRIGEPMEVAALAVFLASDAALFITGAEIKLDGGISSRLYDPL